MPPRILVDQVITGPARDKIVDAVASALRGLNASEDLVAVVSRPPAGKLTVVINQISEAGFVAMIERKLARLK